MARQTRRCPALRAREDPLTEADFKAIYDSGYHHPLVCYLACFAFLCWLVPKLPFLQGYTLSFLFCIAADATVTGSASPLSASSPAYTVFSVVFVVLGDFRYFLLCERITRPADPFQRVLRFAVPVSLLLPVIMGLLHRTVLATANDRAFYAVYESAMVVFVFWLARSRFSKRPVPPEVRAYLREVHFLFAGLYAGWALCDVLILNGVAVAHVLRIVPNVLYYAVFVPFVFMRAPAPLRALPASGASASRP